MIQSIKSTREQFNEISCKIGTGLMYIKYLQSQTIPTLIKQYKKINLIAQIAILCLIFKYKI